MLSSEEIIRLLDLKPLSGEGGYFRETYRAEGPIPQPSLPGPAREPRALATAIYYLITPRSFSVMHRLPADEVYHFYLGDPVEMLQLEEGGAGKLLRIGPAIDAGMRPQVVAPGGVWHGTRLIAGGRVCLMGTTMSPGFHWADYEAGKRETLLASHPRFRDLIVALTRE